MGRQTKENKQNPANAISFAMLIVAIIMIVFPKPLEALTKHITPNIDFVQNNAGNLIRYNEFAKNLDTIWSWVFVVASLLFLFFYRSIIRGRISENFPRDTIKYMSTPLLFFAPFIQFCIGGVFGKNVVPAFIFFDKLTQVQSTYTSLLLYTLIVATGFIFTTMIQYCTIVITDKRITSIDFLNIFKGRTIQFKDIKEIKTHSFGYQIISNNNTIFPLMLPGAKTIYKKFLVDLNQEGVE